MTPEAVAAEVDTASLLGRGGAGFPAGRKWAMLRKAPVTYLVVNGDESEPATFKDHLLIERDPHQLVEGVLIAAYALQVTPGLHLHPGRVRPRPRTHAVGRQRGLRPRGRRAPTSSGRASRSTWWSTRVPAPTSAARRPRCSSRSRASAGSPGSSLRSSRPPSASTASRPWSTTSRPCPTCPGSSSTAAPPSPPSAAAARTGTRLFALAGHVNNPGVFELEMVKTTFHDLIYAPVLGGGIPDGRELKAFIPGGVSAPVVRSRPDRPPPRAGRGRRGRVHARLGVDRGHGRPHLRGAGGLAHHQVLLPRVLRAVHALSRGLRAGSSASWSASRPATGARRTSTSCSTPATTSPRAGVAAPADDHLRARAVHPVVDRLGHPHVP